MNTQSRVDLSNFFQKVIHNNAPSTLVLLALAMATWLIGGNLLVMKHYRRIGKSPWSAFRPFAFPFFKFNFKEWCILALLFLVAMSLGAFGLSQQP